MANTLDPGLRVAETDVSAKAWLRPALAIVCVTVFALAAVSLHQEKIARFVVEEEGPIPSALSHLLFGAPLGFADTGALQYFKLSKVSTAEEAVESAARGDVAATHDLRMPLDGIGIGPPLEDTLALTLFGPHARSLLWLFLALLGISAGSYVLRFRNERLWVAPVFLAALTFLLLTLAMEAPRAVAEAPLGGERSYILLAILTTLHWCFELVASKSQSRRDALFRGVLLGVQGAILGFAILVRYSPTCFLPAVLVSAFLALRSGSAKRGTVLCLVPLAGLIIILYGIVPHAFPEHAASGRLQSLVWHRAFVGFNANPEWPFPGLVEQYVCPQIPGGIVHRGTDSNGHCVWWATPMNQARPAAEVWAELYGTQYEAVLRDAFLDVAARYPGKDAGDVPLLQAADDCECDGEFADSLAGDANERRRAGGSTIRVAGRFLGDRACLRPRRQTENRHNDCHCPRPRRVHPAFACLDQSRDRAGVGRGHSVRRNNRRLAELPRGAAAVQAANIVN